MFSGISLLVDDTYKRSNSIFEIDTRFVLRSKIERMMASLRVVRGCQWNGEKFLVLYHLGTDPGAEFLNLFSDISKESIAGPAA